jgi:hypothetical protein
MKSQIMRSGYRFRDAPTFTSIVPRRVAAGLMMLLISIPVYADNWRGRELEQKWRKAAWRVGPFHLQPSIILSNAGVDSNIYYAPSEPIKDYTLTAGPGLIVYLPLSRAFVLSASGSPQYVYYVKTKRERTWNYYFSTSAALNLRNVFFSLDWKYSRARQRWNTEIDIRPQQIADGRGGSALIQTSRRTSIAVAYSWTKYDYENIVQDTFNIRERLNRREETVSFTGYYQVTSRTRWFVDFELGRYKFEFADTALLKDSRSRAGYAGLEFSPAGRIRGRIRLGYKYFDITNPELKDYRGFIGDSSVSVRLAKPFVVRASYTRDVTFSLWYTNAYYLASTPGAGASLYFLKFFRLDYDYSFGRDRYPEPQDVGGGATVKRLDDFRIHSVGLYFRIMKKTAIGVIASRWTRISNLAYENDRRYFYGLNLIYDF